GTAPPGAPPRPSSTRTVDAAAGTAARLLPVLAHDVTTWRALAARHPGVFLGYARAKCPGGGSRPNSTAPGGHNAEPARAALARRSTPPPGRPHDPITTGLGGDPRRRPPGARRKRRPCGAERRECAHGRFEGLRVLRDREGGAARTRGARRAGRDGVPRCEAALQGPHSAGAAHPLRDAHGSPRRIARPVLRARAAARVRDGVGARRGRFVRGAEQPGQPERPPPARPRRPAKPEGRTPRLLLAPPEIRLGRRSRRVRHPPVQRPRQPGLTRTTNNPPLPRRLWLVENADCQTTPRSAIRLRRPTPAAPFQRSSQVSDYGHSVFGGA